MFNRNELTIKPLSERIHDLDINAIKCKTTVSSNEIPAGIRDFSEYIIKARQIQASMILMMGAHVLRSGVQNYLIDLMERGFISCIAMNGAGMIHDYEFALIGATTESVSRYIKEGCFGLWRETARLNDIINESFDINRETGMGKSVGHYIESSDMPYKNISILAAAARLNIPATVHVGIGYDIIHEHPNCSGAATGALSYNDFLIFAHVVQNLENGVVMNFGSSVMAPEVYLKALSMARNVAQRKKQEIRHFSTLVCDLANLPPDISKEPSKDNPEYYFRPLKTMLIRTVADGGRSFYVKGRHSETIPALWTSINSLDKNMTDNKTNA